MENELFHYFNCHFKPPLTDCKFSQQRNRKLKSNSFFEKVLNDGNKNGNEDFN